MLKVNGTLKMFVIIITVGIALGSIVWSVAIRSEELDGIVIDVGVLVEAQTEVEGRTTELEKAVILIQSDFEHIQTDLTKIIKKLDAN